MFSVCILGGFEKIFNQLAYGGAKNIPVMYIRGFLLDWRRTGENYCENVCSLGGSLDILGVHGGSHSHPPTLPPSLLPSPPPSLVSSPQSHHLLFSPAPSWLPWRPDCIVSPVTGP